MQCLIPIKVVRLWTKTQMLGCALWWLGPQSTAGGLAAQRTVSVGGRACSRAGHGKAWVPRCNVLGAPAAGQRRSQDLVLFSAVRQAKAPAAAQRALRA